VWLNPGISGLENFRDPGIRESRDPAIAIPRNCPLPGFNCCRIFITYVRNTTHSVSVTDYLRLYDTCKQVAKGWLYILPNRKQSDVLTGIFFRLLLVVLLLLCSC